jgi:hypothetical protein
MGLTMAFETTKATGDCEEAFIEDAGTFMI